MLQDYRDLTDEQHEEIEKQTLFAIVHAFQQYSREAKEIFDTTFAESETEVIVLGEDVVQYAIEVAEIYPIDQRFAGFTDYKRVRWLPTAFGMIPQALLVDAKASKEGYRANLQRSQLPMDAELIVQGKLPRRHLVQAGLPAHLDIKTNKGLLPAPTTSIFVHLYYETPANLPAGCYRSLHEIIIFCLPHGRFKHIYNPDADTPSFWRKGKESPGLGELVRIRVSFDALAEAKRWRVQKLTYADGQNGYTRPVWRDTDPDTQEPDDTLFKYVRR